MDNHQYPRPDFQRSALVWALLNGSWDFLFDDEDTGLEDAWYQTGLPTVVTSSRSQDKVEDSKTVTSDGNGVIKTNSEKTKIVVPFTFQTPASGINDQSAHEVLWYERNINDIRTRKQIDDSYRLLLRFGAVDYEAHVWLNGQPVGAHRGGHVPFTIDVTDALHKSSADNRLTVQVRDSPYDLTQPRGKQYWKPQPESIFYTPSSGIWQSVWLESVPRIRIADSSEGTILRSNNIDSGILYGEVTLLGLELQQGLSIEVSSHKGAVVIGALKQNLSTESMVSHIELPMWLTLSQLDDISSERPTVSDTTAWKGDGDKYIGLWSPEHPFLYDVTIKLYNSEGSILDEVHTTVGMRSLTWDHSDNTFRLNGNPYFQALVLDQGYWPDSNITPPSQDALKRDIELSKAMGFNGCRKHQKVEDPLCLYWADKLGYLVWGEMANAFEFSNTYTERFNEEWGESIKRDINHPCIVAWTPVNESWGYDDLQRNKSQREHLRSLYNMTKELDSTRPVNDNDGWEHVLTDLTTFHEYADAPALKEMCSGMSGVLFRPDGRPTFVLPTDDDPGCRHSPTAPIICTEFGGVNIAPAEGDKAGARDWGYTTASDPADLLKRLEALVMAVVDGGLCCGFVYTQLTDIEQEVNGLYSFDREPKLEVAKVKNIMERAKSRYFELLEQRRGIGSN